MNLEYIETKHLTINPITTQSIAAICDDWERGRWALVRVVLYNALETILVFERRAIPRNLSKGIN